MVYHEQDKMQQQQQYYQTFSKNKLPSNSNSSIPTSVGDKHLNNGSNSTSQSRYMKNKLSKSRLEVVNQSASGDYTGASLPPRPSPRQYTNRVSPSTKIDRKKKIPDRSLMDMDDASSCHSRNSRGKGKNAFYSDPYHYGNTDSLDQRNSNMSVTNSTTKKVTLGRSQGTHTSYTGVEGMDGNASETTTQYDNTTVSQQIAGDLSALRSATSIGSGASSELCLPLPYSKLPIARPMFGRENELEALLQYLSEGASITSLIGVGGVGKSHLATHAARKWFSRQPFSRFVVWLNAATELTLRVSYLEALQQVLMGKMQPDDASQQGEVIVVAELLQRQLKQQRRKEQARQRRKEKRRKQREAESRDDCTPVLSEDSSDGDYEEDVISVDYAGVSDEISMDTKALGKLLWDSLLQGVPQEYEWLVVVQNLPRGMGGIKGPAGFKEYFFPIPDTPHDEWVQGRVLLMTRHDSYSGKTPMGEINSLMLGRLDEESSIRMMIANAVFNGDSEIGQENLNSPFKDQILNDATRVATKLVGSHYLDGNPLMITTAIGLVVSNKMPLREYFNNLKNQVAEALERSGYGNGKVPSNIKRETAMSICLEQAMDNAHARGLADVLSSASFICSEGIPLRLLGGNEDRVQELCSMNLLTPTGKDTYAMHRVHQRTALDAIVTSDIDQNGNESEIGAEEFLCTSNYAIAALQSALSSYKPEKASTWRDARSCLPHIEALRTHYEIMESKSYLPPDFQRESFADILDANASVMQWAMKDRPTAITTYKEALRLRRALYLRELSGQHCKSTGGVSDKKIAAGLSQTLASLGGVVDDDQEAQVYYQESLEIYCKAFGEDSKTIELMTLYIALADVETKLQWSEKAYGHYKKAIELYFLIYGHDQNIYADDQKLFLAETLQKIGDLTHHQMKNHAEAELYLEGTVSLLRHLYDEGSNAKNEEMAIALETLGGICHAQGKMKDARQYYRSALKLKDRIHGDKIWTERSNKYAEASRDSRDMSEIGSADNKAVDHDVDSNDSNDSISDVDLDSHPYLKVGDQEKPFVAQTLRDQTQEYAVQLIPVDNESKAKMLSEKDVKMARTLHRLGVMSWNLGSLKQAEDYFEKTLVLQQKAYGADAQNEEIAITLFSLGGLCNDLHDDQEKACDYYRRALKCYHATYGDDAKNESIAQLLHALGQSLLALKKFEDARSSLEKALEMKYVLYGGYGKYNPDIVTTLQDLGKVSRELQSTEDARFYYKSAWEGLNLIHGKDACNPQLASVITQLGGLSYCSGLLADAKTYFEKALALKFELYGDDAYNDDLASTLNNLGSLSARQKNHSDAFDYYRQALDQYSRLSKDKANRDSVDIKQHLARTLHNLGLLSYNLQQYDEAKKFYSQSLKIKSQVYNEDVDSPELALTLSKLSSVEVKQGNTDAAKYYQNQALKRSPTFLETHRKLINKDLLPATPEEAAALISMIPPDSPDYMDHEVIARSLDLWEGLKDIKSHNRRKACFGRELGRPGDHTKTCWYPMKGLREKKQKKDGKKDKRNKQTSSNSNGKK